MRLHHLLAALLLTPFVCVVFVSVWVGFVLLEAAGAVFGVIRTMYRKLRV